MIQEIVVAGVGLLLTGLSGATAIGVQRLLGKTDSLTETVGEHSVRLGQMELKLPNGEWREIKNSVASVHGAVREVQGDLSDLKIEFRERASTEKERMCQAIEETYPRLRPALQFQTTTRMKSKARRGVTK